MRGPQVRARLRLAASPKSMRIPRSRQARLALFSVAKIPAKFWRRALVVGGVPLKGACWGLSQDQLDTLGHRPVDALEAVPEFSRLAFAAVGSAATRATISHLIRHSFAWRSLCGRFELA